MRDTIQAMELITQERARQIKQEGYSIANDRNMYHMYELKDAALCYWGYGSMWTDEDIQDLWPWEMQYWKQDQRPDQSRSTVYG